MMLFAVYLTGFMLAFPYITRHLYEDLQPSHRPGNMEDKIAAATAGLAASALWPLVIVVVWMARRL